eukprot:GHVN01045304.1.p1 GENE.GHVN01045304.1~~GHVN01045304.1.p1  ORF type:complete len:110 (+),score=57.15 GHVN01045304.1:72-401(+)
MTDVHLKTLKILKNPLLCRRQLAVEITHPSENPSRSIIREVLRKKYKVMLVHLTHLTHLTHNEMLVHLNHLTHKVMLVHLSPHSRGNADSPHSPHSRDDAGSPSCLISE